MSDKHLRLLVPGPAGFLTDGDVLVHPDDLGPDDVVVEFGPSKIAD